MARPRSDDKRNAILTAATRAIADHGLGTSTAEIAQRAGISNGSLFTYFPTKAALWNELYRELKAETASAVLGGSSSEENVRQQLFRVWFSSLRWATTFPEKRRALVQLIVSDEITPESRQAGHQAMAGIASLLEKCRETGPLREAPLEFVSALMNALADTTADFMIQDPNRAEQHCRTAFDSLWRMLT